MPRLSRASHRTSGIAASVSPRWLRRAALLALVVVTACSQRPTRDLTLPSGRTVPLLGVGPAVGPLGMLDRSRARDTVFMVAWVAGGGKAQTAVERDELLAWAGSQAERAAIRVVGLQRVEYPFSRLLPFRRGGLSFYERDATGAWVHYTKP